MPRHKFVYDKNLKETPEFQFLYSKWRWLRKQPNSEDFKTFLIFYEWSMENGYIAGAKFERRDESKPFSPDNCLWVYRETKKAYSEEEKEWIKLWDKMVNRIRKHYGMQPIPEMEVKI